MKITEQAVQVFMDSFWGAASLLVDPPPVKTALTASAPYMSGVKVKQLEWREVKSLVGRKLIASDCFGREFARIDLLNHTHDELDIKKAEYQANYENGILSALEPSSAREQVLEEALTETRTDLIILQSSVTYAAKNDWRWEGMSDCVGVWIKRIDAALKSQPAQTGWLPIKEEPDNTKGPFLVTNNPKALNAFDRPSHVWCVSGIYTDDDGSFCAFEGNQKIHGLTMFMPVVAPQTGGGDE